MLPHLSPPFLYLNKATRIVYQLIKNFVLVFVPSQEIITKTAYRIRSSLYFITFVKSSSILDETGMNTVEMRLQSGAMVNLGTCYDKLKPDEVADIVKRYPDKRNKLMVSSFT